MILPINQANAILNLSRMELYDIYEFLGRKIMEQNKREEPQKESSLNLATVAWGVGKMLGVAAFGIASPIAQNLGRPKPQNEERVYLENRTDKHTQIPRLKK